MEKNKIAIAIIVGLALLAIGFFLGFLWTGHFFRNLYTSVNENSASIDRVSGKIASEKMAERGIEQPGGDDHIALGDSHFESGRYAEAAEQYKMALDSDPNDPDTQNDLGLALYYSGKTEAAIEALRKAASAFPSFQRLQLSCGYVLMGAERYDEAEKYLKIAVKLDTDTTVTAEAENFLKIISERRGR